MHDIRIPFQVVRFDSLLYETDSADLPALYEMMRTRHPDFLKFYTHIMTGPGTKVKDTIDFLRAMKHPGLKRLYDTTQMILGDLTPEKRDLHRAFQYVRYYFPDRPIPTIYFYISEFAVGASTYGDSVLAVSLDYYLGKDFPYPQMYFPDYIKRNMDADHLVAWAMHAYANELVGDVPGDHFLDYMISNGKALYLLDHFLPDTPDSILMNYTGAQMQWVKDNEFNMWSHFVHENLLYSTKMKDFRKLINPSPNSTGMPPEAPGRTGNWVGWQIVKAFMRRHPKMTMSELVRITDSKRILKESRYKPRKR